MLHFLSPSEQAPLKKLTSLILSWAAAEVNTLPETILSIQQVPSLLQHSAYAWCPDEHLKVVIRPQLESCDATAATLQRL